MSTHMHPQIVYQITLHYITPYVLPPLFSTKLIVRHQPSLVWKIKTKSSPDWAPKKRLLAPPTHTNLSISDGSLRLFFVPSFPSQSTVCTLGIIMVPVLFLGCCSAYFRARIVHISHPFVEPTGSQGLVLAHTPLHPSPDQLCVISPHTSWSSWSAF